ncbi:hypothetical protein B0T16DRAFT_411146 [Cercophora newfieldiana]|uniref:BTB domain-containing protein n=1 Tax=Cercophora newfieldiana TaxID=92897 RepID=A0AA39Y3U3_9PEZI|nr:hypothetical protein B0T16DRAFT_411146 [Cercophora newfieldiana]
MALELLRDVNPETKVLTYKDIASSKPFRFTIGPEKQEFTIHSALVAAQSPAFDRLVNSEFKEAQDFHVELDNVEEDTFVRFVQFAYTGQYCEPDLDVVAGASNATPCGEAGLAIEEAAIATTDPSEELPQAEPAPEQETLVEERSRPILTKKKKKGKKNTSDVPVFQILNEKFAGRVSELSEEKRNVPEGVLFKENPTTNPFVTHARVFVFADYWGISKLKDISLRKLAKALEGAAVKKSATRDRIVALMQYCCDEALPEELLSLITLFAAANLPALWISGRFRELFGENKKLSVSVVGAMITGAGL